MRLIIYLIIYVIYVRLSVYMVIMYRVECSYSCIEFVFGYKIEVALGWMSNVMCTICNMFFFYSDIN